MLQLLPGGPRFASRFVVFTLSSIVLLMPATLQAQPSQTSTRTVVVDNRGVATLDTLQSGAFHSSRALVHFRPGAAADLLPGSPSARAFPGDRDLYLVQNQPGLSVGEVLRRYRANPNVLYAEPDYVVSAIAVTPNDARWAEKWDMVKICRARRLGRASDRCRRRDRGDHRHRNRFRPSGPSSECVDESCPCTPWQRRLPRRTRSRRRWRLPVQRRAVTCPGM